MLLPQFRDKGIRVQKNWLPIVISQLTESHGKIQGLQRLECIDHPNRTLKTWMEPIALPGQLLTFRGEGLLLLLLSLCFFFPTDLPCAKACPSKIISDSHTCHIIYFFLPSSSMYQLKIFLHEASVNLPNADHPTAPFSPIALPLSSLPTPITSMYIHQVHVHLLINGFKVLWCHIRGYISQLPL